MANDRRELRRQLFKLASEQAGYFSAAQAKGIGYSYSAQAYHVHAGTWLRIDRGLFRLAEWIPDIHDDLARWTVWSKNRAVVSHESALAVHRIGEFESPRIHLTVPRGFRMSDSAVALHFAELPEEDIERRRGFSVTAVARSLSDVASGAPDEHQLARAIEEATERGLVTRRLLRSRSEAVDPVAALRVERALSALAGA
jgi:predicted transcriptional regulator of viral defense system